MIKLENVQDLELKFSEEIKKSTFASYYEAPKINWGPLWLSETPSAFYLIKQPNILTVHFIDYNGKIIRTKEIEDKDITNIKDGKSYIGVTGDAPVLNIEYREKSSTKTLQLFKSKFGKSLEELKLIF